MTVPTAAEPAAPANGVQEESQNQEVKPHPSGPIVNLPKVTIRHYEPTDVDELARIANNPQICRYMRDHFPHPYTLEDAHFWVNRTMTSNPVYNFALADPITNAVIGGLGLVRGTDVASITAEFGYWLSQEYWGRGVMSEAAKGFTDWAFEKFGDLERLHVDIFEANKASVRVVEKAGWVFEGRSRRAVKKKGVVMDVLIYSIIREDWERDRKKENGEGGE